MDKSSLDLKLTKFFMSFFKALLTPSNFASPSNVMTHKFQENVSSWNITFFVQNEPITVQFFRLLSALIKLHPITNAIFEKTRSRFIQILHHSSELWIITIFYTSIFFSSIILQILYIRDKKSSLKKNFQAFLWLCENSPNSSCHI